MKLQHPFPQHKREIFRDIWFKCGECGQNGTQTGGMELHHIRGRVSASVFNGIPLCKRCHNLIGHTFEEESKYMQKIAPYIFRCIKNRVYRMDTEDEQFLYEHKEYYL
jgi:5-methylcytosine-specific restriction endonuclease McrA